MEFGGPTGAGEGVQCPNPVVPSMPRHARWIILAHFVCVLLPTLLWEAKGDLCPHIGGAETHKARDNNNKHNNNSDHSFPSRRTDGAKKRNLKKYATALVLKAQ